jgi:maltose 6'-phosphate phosphatase
MNAIELLYASNTISRGRTCLKQRLEFLILVSNLAHEKQVRVRWSGRHRSWRDLDAEYVGSAGENREIWRAECRFDESKGALPGDVRFALRLRAGGGDYWDNNNGWDYTSEADSGLLAREGRRVLSVDFSEWLGRGQKLYPVTVAVHESVRPRRVYVHWTADGWKTRHDTDCTVEPDYWPRRWLGNASNPNQYGWLMWTAQIPVEHAFRLEYAVSCETNEGQIWDNNLGRNYVTRREPLKILTLNLHCYQEDDQDQKLSLIARAISDLNVDVVCLQEVAEHWNGGRGDWMSNTARIIRERLRHSHYLSYHLYTDWSHLGFDRYREGVALLSKYRFHSKDSRYVSSSRDVYDIHSRRAVMAQVHVPHVGLINVYSVHLSWWDCGFREQFTRLRRWAESEHRADLAATFLCGDFNAPAGSQAYFFVAGQGEYEDQFLEATSRDLFDRVFRKPWRQDPESGLSASPRIDFIFKRKDSALRILSARVLFTDRDYGRVSDHCAYLMEFEPA